MLAIATVAATIDKAAAAIADANIACPGAFESDATVGVGMMMIVLLLFEVDENKPVEE